MTDNGPVKDLIDELEPLEENEPIKDPSPTIKELDLIAGVKLDGTVMVFENFTIFGLEVAVKNIQELILNTKKGMIVDVRSMSNNSSPLAEQGE